jgi:hypothetical protein
MGPGIRNWIPPGWLALVEPAHSLSRQQEKRRRGGSFTPCSTAAPAGSSPYAAMGGEPPPLDVTLVTRAFSLRALTGHDVPPQIVRCDKSPARRVQRRAGGAYIVPPR